MSYSRKRKRISTQANLVLQNKCQKTQEQTQFWVKNPKDMDKLAQLDGFKNISGYENGLIKRNITALNNSLNEHTPPNVCIQPVARLKGGKGAFYMGEENCPKGKILDYYVGKFIRTDDIPGGYDTAYLCEADQTWSIDGKDIGNWSRYINHSDNPNAYLKVVKENGIWIVQIRSLRPIKLGEQIFFDYSEKYKFLHSRMIFLNFNDGPEGPEEFVSKHEDNYIEFDEYMVPKHVKIALENSPADLENYLKKHQEEVGFPLWQKNETELLPIEGQENRTSLMFFSEKGRLDIVKILVKYHTDVNHQNAITGKTALFNVVTSKNSECHEIINFLLENGAKTNIQDIDNFTVLHDCIRYGNHAALKTILKFEPSKKSKYKSPSAWHCMLENTLIRLIDNHDDPYEYCPIMYALKQNKLEMADLLLQHHARLFKKNKKSFFFKIEDDGFTATLKHLFEITLEENLIQTFALAVKWGLNENEVAMGAIAPILNARGLIFEDYKILKKDIPKESLSQAKQELESMPTPESVSEPETMPEPGPALAPEPVLQSSIIQNERNQSGQNKQLDEMKQSLMIEVENKQSYLDSEEQKNILIKQLSSIDEKYLTATLKSLINCSLSKKEIETVLEILDNREFKINNDKFYTSFWVNLETNSAIIKFFFDNGVRPHQNPKTDLSPLHLCILHNKPEMMDVMLTYSHPDQMKHKTYLAFLADFFEEDSYQGEHNRRCPIIFALQKNKFDMANKLYEFREKLLSSYPGLFIEYERKSFLEIKSFKLIHSLKKILSDQSDENLKCLISLLLNWGLEKNQQVLDSVIPILKKRNISLKDVSQIPNHITAVETPKSICHQNERIDFEGQLEAGSENDTANCKPNKNDLIMPVVEPILNKQDIKLESSQKSQNSALSSSTLFNQNKTINQQAADKFIDNWKMNQIDNAITILENVSRDQLIPTCQFIMNKQPILDALQSKYTNNLRVLDLLIPALLYRGFAIQYFNESSQGSPNLKERLNIYDHSEKKAEWVSYSKNSIIKIFNAYGRGQFNYLENGVGVHARFQFV